jgi:hypothetical protein
MPPGQVMYEDNYSCKDSYDNNNNNSKKRLHGSKYGDVIMTMIATLKKHRQAYRTATTLPLLLLIISLLTLPAMLFSAPLAAADVVSDCKDGGGTYVVNAAGQGQCYVTVEPICHKMPHMEVPDPELCLKSGGIINNPTPSACTTTEGGTNAAAVGPAATATTTAAEGNQSTTSELRMQIEQACVALQTGDTQGAMEIISLSFNALGGNSTQVANITTTNTTAASGGAINATNATTSTTGLNAAENIDPSMNSTVSEMEGPGDPLKGIKMGVAETADEEDEGGTSNNPSTALPEPPTAATTDEDDAGTSDTGGTAGSSDEVNSSDDVDPNDS